MALIRKGESTQMIQAQLADLRKAVQDAHGVGKFDLVLDKDKPCSVIVQEVSRDSVSRQLLHMTLMEVHDGDVVKVDVPLVAAGVPDAVDKNLATLTAPTTHLKIRCKMKDAPESIEVDVSGLQEGESLSAGDLVLPKGVELLSSPDATLFSVQKLRQMSEASAEAEAGTSAEPSSEGLSES